MIHRVALFLMLFSLGLAGLHYHNGIVKIVALMFSAVAVLSVGFVFYILIRARRDSNSQVNYLISERVNSGHSLEHE
jgi:hypothetical protein